MEIKSPFGASCWGMQIYLTPVWKKFSQKIYYYNPTRCNLTVFFPELIYRSNFSWEWPWDFVWAFQNNLHWKIWVDESQKIQHWSITLTGNLMNPYLIMNSNSPNYVNWFYICCFYVPVSSIYRHGFTVAFYIWQAIMGCL